MISSLLPCVLTCYWAYEHLYLGALEFMSFLRLDLHEKYVYPLSVQTLLLSSATERVWRELTKVDYPMFQRIPAYLPVVVEGI